MLCPDECKETRKGSAYSYRVKDAYLCTHSSPRVAALRVLNNLPNPFREDRLPERSVSLH